MSENIVLSPDEVQKRRRQREETQVSVGTKPAEKYYNRAGKVCINYESMGRFDIPAELYFSDYTVEDVNNITLSRQEDILENLLFILNKAKNEDSNCNIGDMLIEEFFETLVGIKMKFNTVNHVHRWVCDCQQSTEENDRIVNETIINLLDIQYKSIEEADNMLKDFYKNMFDIMSEEDYKNYLLTKYSNDPVNLETHTREIELSTIKIKEPVKLEFDGVKYFFRFTRIKDMLQAQKLAQKKYAGQIKLIQNRREANVPLSELKEKKQQEIDEIKYKQAKDTVLFSRALTLIKVDDKELTDAEKIQLYPKLPRNIMIEFINFMDNIQFGIQHEQEFVCPLCGTTNKRLLQQELNIVELLPLDASTQREHRESTRLNIYIGL